MDFQEYILESVRSGSYPDTGGICSDDDNPPGNILIGTAMKWKWKPAIGGVKVKVYEPVDDFKYEFFKNAVGQDKVDNYSETLRKDPIKSMYGRLFKYMSKRKERKSDMDAYFDVKKEIQKEEVRRERAMILRDVMKRYLRTHEDDWEDDDIETPSERGDVSSSLFDNMADFILTLDEDQLDDNQMDMLEAILDYLDEEGPEEEGVSEIRYARKTKGRERMKARAYRRRNRAKIRRRRKKFKRTAAGKRRERRKKIMSKRGRTATGRKKVRYHRH